jgi:putative ABC transport system permease protein
VGVEYGPGSRDGRYLRLIARLRQGAGLQQAQAELNVRSRAMEQAHPEADAHLGASIVSLRDELVRPVKAGLVAVEGAVLVFLVIACANIANLLLARWSVRRRQMAIRAALGARRFRLAGMLLTESLVLGGMGGCAGILAAWWGTAALTMMAARVMPDAGTVSLDIRVLMFAIAITLAATILFGAAPLLQLRTANPEETLRSSGRISGDGRHRLRQILAGTQIAMALSLLISAGLLGRSFSRLRSFNPGFEPAGVLTAALSAPQAHYKTDAASAAFLRRVLENLHNIPGVREASAVSVVPLSPDFDRTSLVIPGKTPDSLRRMNPDRYIVAPGYFQAMRIPLREGRWIDERDDESHPPVCVISETAARLWFPGERALGKMVRAGGTANFDGSPMRTIVGIVADVSQYGLGLPSTPQIYMPHAQFSRRGMTLLVRTAGDPEALGPALQKVVLALDAEVPLYNIDSLEHVVANTIAARRVGTWLLAIFAGGALLLAAVGIYGVMAFAVEQRTPEFGIRMALGATGGDVLRHVFASAWPVVLGGLAGGIAASMALSKVVGGFLIGVSSTDAGTYAVISIGVAAIVFAACYRPARRAARIDPLVALRYE